MSVAPPERSPTAPRDPGLVLTDSLSHAPRRVGAAADAATPEPHTPIGVYACGPTIYGRAHLGNWRAFSFYDAVHRRLQTHARAGGRPVRFVMNLTDVDDKTIRGAAAAGVSLVAHTTPHGAAFLADWSALGLRPPSDVPRATHYVPQMVAFVSQLMARGMAYATEDGVYYRLSARPAAPGFLPGAAADLRPGARITVDESKEQVGDFALWKRARPEDVAVGAVWPSPWGPGRPGWHLECSVMSTEILGPTLDLHLGGEDLKFPHHEAEIAQSEGATGQCFARQWAHVAHLMVEGQKMSKSLGNVHTLDDVRGWGVGLSAVKWLLLTGAHYRTPLNFTREGLSGAARALDRLAALDVLLDPDVIEAPAPRPSAASAPDDPSLAARVRGACAQMLAHLYDDLDTPRAAAALFGAVSDLGSALHLGPLGPQAAQAAQAARDLLDALDDWSGVRALWRAERAAARARIQGWADERVQARQAARAARDWAAADRIRDEMRAAGLAVEDRRASDGSPRTHWSLAVPALRLAPS